MTDKERLKYIKYLFLDTYDESGILYGYEGISETMSREVADHIAWLIEQTERVHKLEQENQHYKQALEFYADEGIYEDMLVSETEYDGDGICINPEVREAPIIFYDEGEKARQALGCDSK